MIKLKQGCEKPLKGSAPFSKIPKLKKPDIYVLDVLDDGYEVASLKGKEKGFFGFSKESSPKLYVVAGAGLDNTVFYVGITTGSMKKRFSSGFSRGKSGRRSYVWANNYQKYSLLIWDFSGIAESKDQLEAVEAEFTFFVRFFQSAWPIGLKQISFQHFINSPFFVYAPYFVDKMVKHYFKWQRKEKSHSKKELKAAKARYLAFRDLTYPWHSPRVEGADKISLKLITKK